jgi:hypothetical protein
MFVGDEVRLEVGFTVARDKLARLAEGGGLLSASQCAYGQESTGLLPVGTVGLSKLVRVQVRELAWTAETAAMAIRWEATGPGGVLFPVLDAEYQASASGQAAHCTDAVGFIPPAARRSRPGHRPGCPAPDRYRHGPQFHRAGRGLPQPSAGPGAGH